MAEYRGPLPEPGKWTCGTKVVEYLPPDDYSDLSPLANREWAVIPRGEITDSRLAAAYEKYKEGYRDGVGPNESPSLMRAIKELTTALHELTERLPL